MSIKNFWLAGIVTAGLTTMPVYPALAQQAYPNRPVRFIVPSAVGNQTDISARLLAGDLSSQFGQQVIVDNRPGASGVLGFEMIARAPADGYTLGYGIFPLATNPSLIATLPYDAERDFQMVIQHVRAMNLLTISPSLPVKSVHDLIAHARANPGKLSFASAGTGSTQHLSMELFKQMTGTQLVHVSYKGTPQAITDAMGGQIQVLCDNMGTVLPHVRAGRLRGLGVTTAKRSAAVPELPTIAESGLPGYEVAGWSGTIVPARVSRDIVLRLNAAINKALFSSAIQEKFASYGSTPVGGTPEQFAEHVRRETAKWARVIKEAGIKPG